MTLTENLIILDVTKTESNNCLVFSDGCSTTILISRSCNICIAKPLHFHQVRFLQPSSASNSVSNVNSGALRLKGLDMRTLQMGSQLRILEDLLSLPSPQLQIQDYRYLHFFLTLSSSLLIMPVGCISLKPTLFWAPSLVPSFLHSSSPSSLSSPSRPFSF